MRSAGHERRNADPRDDPCLALPALESSGHHAISPTMIRRFARAARERIRLDGGGYRRDHLRMLAHRGEVGEREVRAMGSKPELLRTLVAAQEGNRQLLACPAED